MALTAVRLGELPQLRVRQLCQALLIEAGARVQRAQPRGDMEDLHITRDGLWRRRPGIVRVLHRGASIHDVADLAAVARDKPYAEAVLIEAVEGDAQILGDPAVHVIRADEFVARLQQSAFVRWENGMPTPGLDRLRLARDLAGSVPLMDRVGLRWLPTLAWNSMPPDLEGHGTPDDLFETVAFRVLTLGLRCGGHRLGSRRRGQRVPDAVIYWSDPDGAEVSALLDCKAAQYGYRMTIDDERALVEYVNKLRQPEADAGRDLRYVLILSSEFDGTADKHPFHDRAASIARDAGGVRLAYLMAADLVRLVVAVEAGDASPALRDRIGWSPLLDTGLITTDDALAAQPEGDDGNV